MIDGKIIKQAGRLLLAAAPPGSGVILFGSHARGDARPDSDLDFLVIEPNVTDQFEEMTRLRDVLRSLRVRADVVVTNRKTFEKWRTTPNNMFYDAAREGKEVHELG